MKNFKYAVMVLLAATLLSCSSDDETATISGEGNLTIEFDNAYNTSDLLLETTTYSANNPEEIKINAVKYIVSNIKLEDDNGNIFVYPKNESYFIVNESDVSSQFISLKNVPAANYTKLTFGIGVDQEKYQQGAEGQGAFLEQATEEGMMWSWQAGYKFLVYEGLFTSTEFPEETAFAIHMGSHGSALDNYKEVTVNLPVSAKLRTNKTPEIHVISDVSKILNGPNKLYLEEKSQIHVDPEKAPLIAENATTMFSVDHVHNE